MWVVVEEAPSHTHRPPPPPIATAAACRRSSLHHRGASRPTASAAFPPTIPALFPRMQTSTPSLPPRCPQTSPVRYEILVHSPTKVNANGLNITLFAAHSHAPCLLLQLMSFSKLQKNHTGIMLRVFDYVLSRTRHSSYIFSHVKKAAILQAKVS